MAEVLLTSNESNVLPMELMNNHAQFFSFYYNISAGELRKNRFELIKGIDMTMVEWKR